MPVAGSALLRVFASVLAVVTHWLKEFARARRHRREANVLAGLDRHMLADIGITRTDLRDAFSEPFWDDPTALLRERALERRLNHAVTAHRIRADAERLPSAADRPPGAPDALTKSSKRPIPLIGRSIRHPRIPLSRPDPAPAGPSGGRSIFTRKISCAF